MIVQTLVIIASMIFILTCPGNHARTNAEVSNLFKDMNMLSFLDKVGLGFTSTMGLIIGKGNIIYTLFTLLIAV